MLLYLYLLYVCLFVVVLILLLDDFYDETVKHCRVNIIPFFHFAG